MKNKRYLTKKPLCTRNNNQFICKVKERDDKMKKAKTIKIFPAPHVEIRLHVSEEMEEDFKKCYFSEGMYSCRKCSWCKVKMEGTIICRFSTFKREMLRQLGLEQK